MVVAVILESRSPGSVVAVIFAVVIPECLPVWSVPGSVVVVVIPECLAALRVWKSVVAVVIPGVDLGSSLFIRETLCFISGFRVPARMRAPE